MKRLEAKASGLLLYYKLRIESVNIINLGSVKFEYIKQTKKQMQINTFVLISDAKNGSVKNVGVEDTPRRDCEIKSVN